jgi:hypothetical protein
MQLNLSKLKWSSWCVLREWGWTARNLIARQSTGRHFWQEINCSNGVKPGSTQLQFEQLIFLCLKVKLLKSSWSPKINRIWPVDRKSDICLNGVEQLKNHVDRFLSYQILSRWSWKKKKKILSNFLDTKLMLFCAKIVSLNLL